MGNPNARRRRNHAEHHRRTIVFRDYLHRPRYVLVELRLRGITRRRRFVDVFRPTRRRRGARLVLPGGENHATFSRRRRINRRRDINRNV